MGKKITARIYIGGEPVSKVEYKTGENNRYGKKLARLVLDEFAAFTKVAAEADDASWSVTYTDGADEFAFSSNLRNGIDVERNGEVIEILDDNYVRSTKAMWTWLAERGWY